MRGKFFNDPVHRNKAITMTTSKNLLSSFPKGKGSAGARGSSVKESCPKNTKNKSASCKGRLNGGKEPPHLFECKRGEKKEGNKSKESQKKVPWRREVE